MGNLAVIIEMVDVEKSQAVAVASYLKAKAAEKGASMTATFTETIS